jgi:hypothetical protein
MFKQPFGRSFSFSNLSSLLQMILSKLSDKVGCCPAVDFHGPALGLFAVLLVDGGISVGSRAPLVARKVAKHDPEPERLALASVCSTEGLMAVELPGPIPAAVTAGGVILENGRGVATVVKRHR